MRITLPDDILRRAEANVTDVRIALAITLYADNRIDHADACRLADVPPAIFNRELLAHNLSVQEYPTESKRLKAS